MIYCTIKTCCFNSGQDACRHEEPEIFMNQIGIDPQFGEPRGVGICRSMAPIGSVSEDYIQERRKSHGGS